MAEFTDKQAAFCEEYIVDLNATQAAIRAGYAPDSANREGSRLMSNVDIRARIGDLMDARSKRTLVHADYVVDSLIEVANRCQQAVPVMEFDPVEKCMKQKGAEDGEPVWEFDSQGANKALELLGKHLGIFTDKSKNENIHEILVRYADRNNAPASPHGADGGAK